MRGTRLASWTLLSLLSLGPVGCGPTDRSSDAGGVEPADAHGAEPGAHWGYEEEGGPAAWADLSPEFALCETGQAQSPIDLSAAQVGEFPSDLRPTGLRVFHVPHTVDVVNTGHTIQVTMDPGGEMTIGDDLYALVQYHFHAPSEHTVDGRHFPMEMHAVHESGDGELAVFGVLVEEGAHNPAFTPVWGRLPPEEGGSAHLEQVTVDVDDLLPEDRRTYRYVGSLTTPPCTEGVRWFVFVEPIEFSAEQIARFTALFDHNNRPVQRRRSLRLVVDTLE